MPTSARRWLANPIVRFGDQVLRGIGQVMLQNNPVTGLLFLVGIFVNSWVYGLYALLGTVVSTGTAQMLGARRDYIDRGLCGFNGTLVGLGLAVYLQHGLILLVYVTVASVFVTIVAAAIKDMFGTGGHALTAPFVLTTWIFIGAIFTLTQLHGAPVLGAPHLPTRAGPFATALSPAGAGIGILNGVAQVMFQQNVWTGAFFFVGLAVNSRFSCLAAALGSAIAVGIAWYVGASPSAIRAGLFGFNAVLTAIAIGGLFFLLHPTTVLLTILAVCASTIFYGALAVVLGPLGLPVLTAPFVVTTWLCLLARGGLTRLQELSPAAPTTPEGNLNAARQAAPKEKRK